MAGSSKGKPCPNRTAHVRHGDLTLFLKALVISLIQADSPCAAATPHMLPPGALPPLPLLPGAVCLKLLPMPGAGGLKERFFVLDKAHGMGYKQRSDLYADHSGSPAA